MSKFWNNKNGCTSTMVGGDGNDSSSAQADHNNQDHLQILNSKDIKKEIDSCESSDNSSTITKSSDCSSSSTVQTNTSKQRFNLRKRNSSKISSQDPKINAKKKNYQPQQNNNISNNNNNKRLLPEENTTANNQPTKRLRIKKEILSTNNSIIENGQQEETITNGKSSDQQTSNSTNTNTNKMIIYNRNDFLAVRNEENSFFLCRAKQNIYKNGRKIKILWYSGDEQQEKYKPDYIDSIDFECILTNLRITSLPAGEVSLPASEKTRALNILNRAINVEKGINEPPDPTKVLSDGLDISIIGKVKDEDVLEKVNKDSNNQQNDNLKDTKRNNNKKSTGVETTTKHKSKSNQQIEPCLNGTLEANNKDDKLIINDSTTIAPKTTNKSKNHRKHNQHHQQPSPLDRQLPDSSSPFYTENYLLPQQQLSSSNSKNAQKQSQQQIPNHQPEMNLEFETRTPLPFISKYVNSKLLIRAIKLDDYKFLSKLIEEIQENKINVFSISIGRSVDIKLNAVHYAIMKEDLKLLRLLEEIENKIIEQKNNEQEEMPYSIELYHSELMLDHQHINNRTFPLDHTYAKFILKQNISSDFCWKILPYLKDAENDMPCFRANIIQAIKCGNYELSLFFTKKMSEMKPDDRTMQIYYKVLSGNLSPENDRQLLECCIDEEFKLYPIHIAAINPDPHLFHSLVNICSNQIYLANAQDWMPIHFASVCQTFFNLKHLLNLGVSTRLADSKGNTVLHLATKYNRIKNVALIIRYESSQPLVNSSLFNSYNHKGFTPMHIACQKGHADIIAMFIEHEVRLDFPTSNLSGELTPLMIAAKYGHLSICKLLVDNGANINVFDKKNRSALTYAVINGHSNVVTYFLELDANPSGKDLFGNNLFHYALAYGWHSCYDLLVRTNINLKDTNMFGLTPIYASFMKGHIGFVDYILKKNILSVNVPVNDTGINLFMLTFLMTPGTKSLDYLRLFVETFKCDLSKTDYEGNNTLHYLLKCEAKHKNFSDSSVINAINNALTVVLQNGCDIYLENHAKISPITFSLKNQCFVSFSRFFKDYYQRSNKFQKILSESEYFWPMIIANCMNEFTIDNIKTDTTTTTTFGQYIMNMAGQDKNFMSLLKQLALKTNVSSDLPIEYLVKISKHLENGKPTTVTTAPENKLMGFFDFIAQFYEKEFLEDIFLLHLAARFGTSCIVKRLLDLVDKVDVQNESLETPLATAIINDNTCAAEVFLSMRNSINVDFEIQNQSCFLYYLKTTTSSLCLIHSFLKHPNIHHHLKQMTDHEGNCALHLICQNLNRNDFIESVRLFVEQHGMDVNRKNQHGQTALHVAFKMNKYSPKMFQLLDLFIKHGIDICHKDSNGYNAFSYLFFQLNDDRNQHKDILQLIKLLDVNRLNLLTDKNQTNLLHYACKNGLADCSNYLLSYFDPNIVDKLNNTALSYALDNSHRDCALVLLKSDKLKMLMESISKKDLIKKICTNCWNDVFFIIEERILRQGESSRFIELLIKSQCLKYATNLMKTNKLSMKNTVHLKCFAENTKFSVQNDIQNEFLQLFQKEQIEPIVIELFAAAICNWNANLCFQLIEMFGIQKILTKLREKNVDWISMSFKRLIFEQEFNDPMKKLLVKLIQESPEKDLNILSTYPIIERKDSLPRFSFPKDHESNYNSTVNYSPLIVAIITKSYQTVEWLLNDKSLQNLTKRLVPVVDVNFTDSLGRLPLVHAILNNDVKMVKLMLGISDDDEQCKATKLKTLRLLKRDNQNMTIFHHLISPFENGSFHQADHIYSMLWKIMNENNTSTSEKILELKNELINYANEKKMLAMFLTAMDANDKQQATVNHEQINGNENSEQQQPKKSNFRCDYESLLEELTITNDNKKSTSNTDICKRKILSDDSMDNIPFDVMFTKWDQCQKSNGFSNGNGGMYNFYKVQLLSVGTKYCLLIRWGQVGTLGNITKLFYDCKEEATKVFKKIYKNKSGENWIHVNSYVNAQDNYKVGAGFQKRLDFTELHKKLSAQESLIISHKMKEMILKFMKRLELIDNKREFPYETLSTKSMESCSFTLNHLSELITYNSNKIKNQKEYLDFLNDIIDLSEQFYVYIKIFGKEFDQLQPILNIQDIQNKFNLVKKLKSIVFAMEFMYYLLNRKTNDNAWEYLNSTLKWDFNHQQQVISKEEKNFIKYYLSMSNVEWNSNEELNVFRINSKNNNQQSSSTEKINTPYLLWYHLKHYELFNFLMNGFECEAFLLPTEPQIIVHGIGLTNKFDHNLLSSKEKENENGYLILCEVWIENALEIINGHNAIINKNCQHELNDKDCVIIHNNNDNSNTKKDYLYWKNLLVPINGAGSTNCGHIIQYIHLLSSKQNNNINNKSKILPRYLLELPLSLRSS